MKRLGLDCVYLDISHKDPEFVKQYFPNIYARLLEYGFDLTKEPIPVVPAAHYTCGGIIVDKHARTDIPGLYAAGEVTSTGLHGANRMASNSLLECLVYARAAAEDILATTSIDIHPEKIKPWDESWVHDSEEEILVAQNWDEIRRFMWNYVGIVRSNKRLERALARINLLKREIQEYYANFKITRNLLELRNLIVVAELIVTQAIARKESIGLHYNIDYPPNQKNKE
jgi:L-aspartate oxidase